MSSVLESDTRKEDSSSLKSVEGLFSLLGLEVDGSGPNEKLIVESIFPRNFDLEIRRSLVLGKKFFSQQFQSLN